MNTNKAPLWKQLVGALAGGALALALYGGYDYAAPKLTAYLTIPEPEGGRTYDLGASHINDKTMDEGNRKRIISRNMRAAGVLQDNAQNDPAVLDAADNHSMDIGWQEPEQEMAEPMTDTSDVEVEEPMDWEEENMMEETMWMEPMPVAEPATAEALPDTGFGIGFLMIGAAGGAWGARKRRG